MPSKKPKWPNRHALAWLPSEKKIVLFEGSHSTSILHFRLIPQHSFPLFLEEGRAYSLVPYYVILDSKSSKEYKQNKSYIVNVEVHS